MESFLSSNQMMFVRPVYHMTCLAMSDYNLLRTQEVYRFGSVCTNTVHTGPHHYKIQTIISQVRSLSPLINLFGLMLELPDLGSTIELPTYARGVIERLADWTITVILTQW